jgi:hypothetical protein
LADILFRRLLRLLLLPMTGLNMALSSVVNKCVRRSACSDRVQSKSPTHTQPPRTHTQQGRRSLKMSIQSWTKPVYSWAWTSGTAIERYSRLYRLLGLPQIVELICAVINVLQVPVELWARESARARERERVSHLEYFQDLRTRSRLIDMCNNKILLVPVDEIYERQSLLTS